MAEKEKRGPSLDLSTVVLAMVIVGGAVLSPAGLQSSRPNERQAFKQKALGDQIVPARLWQDPFEVALAYHGRIHGATNSLAFKPDQTNAPIHTVSELGQQIARHRGTRNSTNPVTILEVMVSGGSY